MDEEYDVIVCGTGLKECILSGLLSSEGKKVLQLDRNNYYGGETSSLNITNLWKKHKKSDDAPKELGANRDWNVDSIPKFIMADGLLVKMLLHTNCARYLKWRSVHGVYVYRYQEGGWISSEKFIHKMPQTPEEVLGSSLMSMSEKYRLKTFLQFVVGWDIANPQSLQGVDPNRHTMQQVFEKFSLDDGTIDLVGHCLALQTSDEYKQGPSGAIIDKIKLYYESISRFGKTPFIYPLWGLGTMSEGFCRYSAIRGCTYMLNKQVDGFEYDADGKVIGVRSGEEVAKTKLVVCDPSYVQNMEKTRAVGQVIRAICILDHPIPSTGDAPSCQIILTAREMKRKNDIFIMCMSAENGVCAQGKYIAIVSTQIETQNPTAEIHPALKLLGNALHIFCSASTMWVPTDDGSKDNIIVTSSYDPTSHFEAASKDVMETWKRLFGQELVLTVHPDAQNGEEDD